MALLKGKILALNCGSSTIKGSIFHFDGKSMSRVFNLSLPISDGIRPLFEKLGSSKDYIGIGHRFVHGGDRFGSTQVVTPNIIEELRSLSELAPLHNPASLEGINQSLIWDGSITQVVVFDTAFHHTLPPVASHYGIDLDLAERLQIKRYGFHGIANAYDWEMYANVTGNSKGKVIIMHLGNGSSITAVQDGHSVDTSMGFSPLEGLMMGTRSGDIDPAVVAYLSEKENQSPAQIIDRLNFQSGLLGVSGISSDMVTLLSSKERTDRTKLALDLFCYKIVKYLGAYTAVLGGADALIFSGGIGENASEIRAKILKSMEWLGVKINEDANHSATGLPVGSIVKISSENSAIVVYIIVADENHWIAREVIKSI